MSEAKHAGVSPALIETIAGLLAGSLATLVVHPLDIVKTRMQSESWPSLAIDWSCRLLRRRGSVHQSMVAASSGQPTTLSVMRGLLAQSRNPVAAVYRGLMPNLVGNATSWASFFFFKNGIERTMAAVKPHGREQQPKASFEAGGQLASTSSPSAAAGTGTATATGEALLAPSDFFAASLLAGALTQVITNPIWVLKTRLVSSDRTATGADANMWAAATRLYREEGPLGFYRGLGVGMLAVSHGAVQFAVYEPAKQMYFSARARRQERAVVDGGPMTTEATMVLSTLAKVVAGTVTYPLQVVRSRLQIQNSDERFGRGVRGVTVRLWREEGARGFYRGMVPGVIRVLPATWVTFLVYENVRYHLPRWTAPPET